MRFKKFGLSILLCSLLSPSVYAIWQIEYSDHIINFTGGPKKRGNFSTRSECEKARDMSSRQSGTYSSMMAQSQCVGSDSGGGSANDYTGKYQVQYMIMESLLKNFMDQIDQDQQQEALRQQHQREQEALQREKEERLKQQSRQDWEKLKAQEVKDQEFAKQKKLQEIDDLMISMQLEGKSSDDLGFAPMTSNTKNNSKNIDTSLMQPLQRLACTKYFSKKAADILQTSDVNRSEKAREYNLEAENVASGRMISEQCGVDDLPQPPQVSNPVQVSGDENSAKAKEQQAMMKKIIDEMKKLEEIKTKIAATEEAKSVVIEKKNEAMKKIEDIKTKPQGNQDDTSLTAAQQLLLDSQNELDKLSDLENQLNKSKDDMQSNLKDLYNQTKQNPVK